MRVRVAASEASVVVEVFDDGVGGADPASGNWPPRPGGSRRGVGRLTGSCGPRRRRDVSQSRVPARPSRVTVRSAELMALESVDRATRSLGRRRLRRGGAIRADDPDWCDPERANVCAVEIRRCWRYAPARVAGVARRTAGRDRKRRRLPGRGSACHRRPAPARIDSGGGIEHRSRTRSPKTLTPLPRAPRGIHQPIRVSPPLATVEVRSGGA